MRAPVRSLALLLFGALCATSGAQVRYRVIDLGEVPGDNGSIEYQAGRLGNNGRVVGNYFDLSSAFNGAFEWTANRGMVPVTLPAGGIAAIAFGQNARGAAAGLTGFFAGFQQATVWDTPTQARLLGPVPQFGSEANDIADDGTVYGDIDFQPTVWAPDGTPSFLAPPAGFDGGIASRHNHRGQVAGFTFDPNTGNEPALIWDSHGVPALIGLLPGSFFTSPSDLNDHGVVVGQATLDTFFGISEQAFVWTQAGGLQKLPDLGSRKPVMTVANGVNIEGTIVGASTGPPQFIGLTFAVMWQGGAITDLNTLIDQSTGWLLTAASGINDRGEIAGTGIFAVTPFGPFLDHAFLLEPIK